MPRQGVTSLVLVTLHVSLNQSFVEFTLNIRSDIVVSHTTSSVLETLEKWVSNELQREKETDDMSPTSIVHSQPRPRAATDAYKLSGHCSRRPFLASEQITNR